MAAPAKRKGTDFERELVNTARAAGLEAERAWGSNGEALGEAATVDLVVQGLRIQAKRRRALPSYLAIPDGCDAVVFRQDRGEALVLLRWGDVVEKLQEGDW